LPGSVNKKTFYHFRVILQQERVAFLQQQLQKEEESAAAVKIRLEQAQASRIAAEEELATQEAMFAEKQVKTSAPLHSVLVIYNL
jgi:hypothetical protein